MAWTQDIATALGRAYTGDNNFVAQGGALDALIAKDPELKQIALGLQQGTVSPDALQNFLVDREITNQKAAIPGYGSLAKPAYKQYTPYETPAPEFQAFDQTKFQESPDYQFRLSEGQKAIDRAGSARGGFYSGAALKEAARYGSNLAAGEYDASRNRYNDDQNTTYGRWVDDRNRYVDDFKTGYGQAADDSNTLFNRLSTLSGRGSTAVSNNVNNANNFANNAGSIYGQSANVNAAGTVANANNLAGSISSVSDILRNSFGQSSYGGNLPWQRPGNINPMTGRSY